MSVSTQSEVGLPALPRLTTTVPKEYVHRASLAEVFLSGCTARDDLRFSLTGQWPRVHSLFNSADGRSHDPLQAAETFRQATMFVSHAELGIPLDHHFVMWDLSYTTDLEQLRISSAPTDFDVEVRCSDITRRRGTVSQLRVELSIHRDGTLVAHGGIRFSLITPSVYSRLRANRPDAQPTDAPAPGTHRVPPASVGRRFATDVVLSPTDQPGRWLLTPDLNHPILFEHHADHVPGMVLLEGARQAASALIAPRGLTPTSASTTFYRYAELDRPCWIDVTHVSPESGGMMTVEVTGHQDGTPVFTTTITGPVV
ncbi:ScbA/BarX family gamma-butyrolactone biosynthesis protein [Streptomyces sp. NPDC046915]|uniref:ScbA/BarX family gamma-butyrolactone biosynthesis protein n=1 Tax=Streptomyces sp. NPDC046915 TaxID=3155257 RepID=UPI0033C34169